MNQQQTGDMPTIQASSYTTSNWSGVPPGADTNQFVIGHANYISTDAARNIDAIGDFASQMRRIQAKATATTYNCAGDREDSQSHQNKTTMTKRIVRVYLADTDDNVPLAQSLLFSSEEKFTDLTDQELYFEIPIKEVLAKHNALRATIVNKKATERIGKEIFLDPVKIRDLKMTVVSIATF